MAKHVQNLLPGIKYLNAKPSRLFLRDVVLYHSSGEPNEESLPYSWYKKMFLKLTKLSHMLKDFDLVDGKLVNIKGDSKMVADDRVRRKMHTFKSLARVFIGCPYLCKKDVQFDSFGKPSEREPLVVSSLTTVSDVLNVSAQQRKIVRFTLCPQVTQNRIWTGALEYTLNGLKEEIDLSNQQCPNENTELAQQIIFSCLKFLSDSAVSCEPESNSWMRPAPVKVVGSCSPRKWEEVFDMFNDLINFLKNEEGWSLLNHVTKLEVMKEGLAQIRDVFLDNSIGYREIRHHENLVQKKLTKTLGHSSRCLFTLLLYYLYGCVRDIEVDMRGGIYETYIDKDQKVFCLRMGRILTSGDDKMVRMGVKQLDRALGLYKFVWETAGMKEVLELEGHIWCVGVEQERSLTYRGKRFLVHGISL